jgi:hypothetical protein
MGTRLTSGETAIGYLISETKEARCPNKATTLPGEEIVVDEYRTEKLGGTTSAGPART